VLLRGSFRNFVFYDVGEAFDLDKLRDLLGSRGATTQPAFPRRTPEYVRFEEPPIVEASEPVTLGSGAHVSCSVEYYAYAIVVVQLESAFEGDWDALLTQASRWMDSPEVEPHAREVVRRHLQRVAAAVIKPREDWLREDYLVVQLREIQGDGNLALSAEELLSAHGQQIAQLIRGELTPLAPTTTQQILEANISYYPSDLLVAGSSVALVYDRSDEAAATIQILEYAKIQLLEFRYYDNFMTRVLTGVYNTLDQKRNILFSRWSLPRDANRFNTIRLDVMELTERIDNAIKFVSDAFYARVYRLAASRVGVPEYRDLVEKKLDTARELYDSMVDQFHEARSFVLEVAVAILALLDVLLLLRGK